MRSIDEIITLSEKEEGVKTYHATTLKSSLGFLNRQTSEGFVTVTNKRVILHAHSDSFGGGSMLVSEVPVQNVSGISSYMGKSTSLVWVIVSGILGLMGLGQLFGAFYSFSPFSGAYFNFNFGALVFAVILGGFAYFASKKILNTIFSLQVFSSGADAAPIALGGGGGGLFSQGAAKALTASPAEDSELLIRELGALVLELQTMGDMAIKKWKGKEKQDGSQEESSQEQHQKKKLNPSIIPFA